MPIYSYICDSCGEKSSIFKSMSQYNSAEICPVCREIMRRDIAADSPRAHGKRYYGKPLHSDSLAIAPSQVAEHRKRFPGIEIDSECRPVFAGYKQHDNYLKETGFVKMPQMTRRKFAKKKRKNKSTQ